MNILFLTQILPYPPDAGPKVKTWHVLQALIQQGHSIYFASFVRPEEMEHVPVLEEICKEVHIVPIRRSRVKDIGYMLKSYFSNRPFLVERDNLPAFQEVVNKIVQQQQIDFIHADQLTMVQFAIRGASKSQNKKTKVIFDAHNAVWTIVERMRENVPWYLKPILSIEANRVKRYEGELLRTVDHVLAVTDVDRASLEDALKIKRVTKKEEVSPITVIPISVNTQQIRSIQRNPDSTNIVTLGTLHYPPNADGIRWFIEEAFPLIRKKIPDVTLTIIGKNPPKDFLRLAADPNAGVVVTGFVPKLEPYFKEAALTVIPVRAGGGMRVRILEAFAYAMPIVTTTVGLEGIKAQPGKDILVEDDPEAFARAVIRLLNNKELQNQLAANGRRLVEMKYDWQVTLRDLEKVYR
jgi:glycosyltransferase involved in cell wall biosynthesis